MVFGWGSERSTDHARNVSRVKNYLKTFCIKADKETGLVSSRITDAWGYNKKLRTWYICEIKVNLNDLHKAVTQIHDTIHRFKPKNHPLAIIPVVAIPNRLYMELKKYETEKWESFCSLCRTVDVAIWVIMQSSIKQIQGPKPQKPKTTARKSTTKAKITRKRKATSKPKATKTRKSSAKTKSKAKSKPIAKVNTVKKRKPTTKKKIAKTKRKSVKKR
jgi:hypothetical protein